MKVTLEYLNIDENSTKLEPLEYAGIKVGEYSYGLWSKFYNSFIPNGQYVPDAVTYTRRMYYLKYGKSLHSKEEILDAVEALKKDGYTFSSFAEYVMTLAINTKKVDSL